MENTSLFNFVVRGLLQISAYIVRQLPSSMGVRIDQVKFTSAFTMKDNAQTIAAKPWPEAPDVEISDKTFHFLSLFQQIRIFTPYFAYNF